MVLHALVTELNAGRGAALDFSNSGHRLLLNV